MNCRSLFGGCVFLALLSTAAVAADDEGLFVRGNIGDAMGETDMGRSVGSMLGLTVGGQVTLEWRVGR